jgi:hypothetical protein
VTIKYGDARRGQVVLDVNAAEVADLAAKGTSKPAAAANRKAQAKRRRSVP